MKVLSLAVALLLASTADAISIQNKITHRPDHYALAEALAVPEEILELVQTKQSTDYSVPAGIAAEDQQLFEWHNKVRADPTIIIQDIKDQMATFKNWGTTSTRVRQTPTGSWITLSEEAAFQEAIDFLEKQPAVGPLTWTEGLAWAARSHTVDMGGKGITGHTSSDGTGFGDRLYKFAATRGQVGENLAYGSTTGKWVVIQLIVDEAVPSRGHRTNIFNDDFTQIGTNTGVFEGQYGMMETCNYGNGFVWNNVKTINGESAGSTSTNEDSGDSTADAEAAAAAAAQAEADAAAAAEAEAAAAAAAEAERIAAEEAAANQDYETQSVSNTFYSLVDLLRENQRVINWPAGSCGGRVCGGYKHDIDWNAKHITVTRTDKLTFYDCDGNVIKVDTSNTWSMSRYFN